jgi:PIN domain nuclease of toxin-antitoxin system
MEGHGIMITLDTHVIIWDALNQKLVSNKAKDEIRKANQTDGIIFCEISLWEIAMLIKKKRIIIDISYQEFVGLIKATNNYLFKGITPEIAELSTNFPNEINLDPADRIISATSIISNTPLITADKNLLKSKLKTIW